MVISRHMKPEVGVESPLTDLDVTVARATFAVSHAHDTDCDNMRGIPYVMTHKARYIHTARVAS